MYAGQNSGSSTTSTPSLTLRGPRHYLYKVRESRGRRTKPTAGLVLGAGPLDGGDNSVRRHLVFARVIVHHEVIFLAVS